MSPPWTSATAPVLPPIPICGGAWARWFVRTSLFYPAGQDRDVDLASIFGQDRLSPGTVEKITVSLDGDVNFVELSSDVVTVAIELVVGARRRITVSPGGPDQISNRGSLPRLRYGPLGLAVALGTPPPRSGRRVTDQKHSETGGQVLRRSDSRKHRRPLGCLYSGWSIASGPASRAIVPGGLT